MRERYREKGGREKERGNGRGEGGAETENNGE